MEQCRVYQADTLKSILIEGEDAGESLLETALRVQLEDVGSPTRSTQGRRRSRQNSARSLDSLRSATGSPNRLQVRPNRDVRPLRTNRYSDQGIQLGQCGVIHSGGRCVRGYA
jgi:hypothetical protein